MTDDSFFFERKWDGRGDYSANPTAFAHFICLIVSLGFADTLEPKTIDWSKEEKTLGKTAIPEGTYKVEMRYSTKFKTQMPFLQNVPHFEGIMLHVGNSVRDSRGCILVGTRTFPSVLTHSRDAVNRLILLIEEHKGESITVSVENHF